MILETSTADFQTILINFCREENFKKYVREAINSELFWREMLQRYQLDSHIESKVKSTVPDLVKNQTSDLKSSIQKSVNEKLDTYSKSLSGNIALELNNQVPAYLNNNYRMGQILDSHTQQLNNTLYESAKQTLDKLTNEEKYQVVTASHLNNMSIRYNTAIDNQLQQNTMKFDNQFLSYTNNINTAIQTVNNKTEQSLTQFNNFNSTAKTLTDKINQLEKELVSMKFANTIKDCFLGLCGTGLLGFCFWIYFKK